jgi:hypothetical protein
MDTNTTGGSHIPVCRWYDDTFKRLKWSGWLKW